MTISQNNPDTTQASASASTGHPTPQPTPDTQQQPASDVENDSPCPSQSALLFPFKAWERARAGDHAPPQASPTTSNGTPPTVQRNLDPVIAGVGGWDDQDLENFSGRDIDFETELSDGDEAN
ncbi:hypothetical protein ACHAQH_009649 [Verticillium albo-atrum]